MRSYFATSQSRQDEDDHTSHEPEERTMNKRYKPHYTNHTSKTSKTVEDNEPIATVRYSNVPRDKLRESIRRMMRQVTSCPVVVTAAHIDPNIKRHVPLGLVVSSFNTVTLDPPHISFNIKRPSKTLDAIHANNGLFRIHMLSASSRAARIVDSFAQGNTEEAYLLRNRWLHLRLPKDPYAQDATPSLAPQITGSSVVAAMECELTQEAIVGDHVIAIAKVNDLTITPNMEPCLTYRNGDYRTAGGAVLGAYSSLNAASTPDSPATIIARQRYWQYPLFPGKAERDDLIAVLKSYLQGHPKLLGSDSFEAVRQLRAILRLPAAPLGINLQRLLEECKLDATDKLHHAPLVSDFYGPLGHKDITSIVDRATKLATAVPEVLEMRYTEFLDHLNVSKWSTGLLASDILDPLRTKGLVPPFEHIDSRHHLDSLSKLSIINLEQVEVKLRNYIKTVAHAKLIKTDSGALQKAINAPSSAQGWISRVRSRLIVEAFPQAYNAPNIDLRGELTPEEVRVAIHRLMNDLNPENINVLKQGLLRPRLELLRRAGIHPLTSNMGLEFFFHKLHRLVHNFTNPENLSRDVDELLSPLFEKRVFTWEEVDTRVRTLVSSHTLQVLRWPLADILAALGFDQSAKMKTPISDNKPHMRDSGILSALITKELKARYGSGTLKENDAIKAFLKTRYNYDVVMPESAPKADRGAAEEMEHEMRLSLNVNVPEQNRKEMELVEALELFGRHPGGSAHEQLMQRLGWGEGRSFGVKTSEKKSQDGWEWKKVELNELAHGERETTGREGDAQGEGQEGLSDAGEAKTDAGERRDFAV